jgi:hypothetical protein
MLQLTIGHADTCCVLFSHIFCFNCCLLSIYGWHVVKAGSH